MVRSGVDVAVEFAEVADAVLADAFGLVFAVELVPVWRIGVEAEARQREQFQGFLLCVRLHTLPSVSACLFRGEEAVDSGCAVGVGLVERLLRLGDLAELVGEFAVVRAAELLEEVWMDLLHIAVEYGDYLRLGDPVLPSGRVFLGFLGDFELEDDTPRLVDIEGFLPQPAQESLLVERGREVREADGLGSCHYGDLAVDIEVLADRLDGLERVDAAMVEDGACED